MITVNKKNTKAMLRSLRIVSIIVGMIVLLGLAVLVLGPYVRPYPPSAESVAAMQAGASSSDDLYLIVRRADNLNDVVGIDPKSGKVNRKFEVGYNAVARLTTDKSILYVFNQPITQDAEEKGALSAIALDTGVVLWKVDLPGWPFVGSLTDGIWLSVDERVLYLQATREGLFPRIFAVDARTGALMHDFAIPLSCISGVGFPRTWKLPWAEVIVIVCGDQISTFDLTSGQASRPTSLVVDPQSLQRVPKSFPRGYFAQDGALDPDARQLILATAPQEIISVNLDTQPFTIKTVFSLPTGWQFGGRRLVLPNPKEGVIYVQVKRADTPIVNGLEAEEVWTFDSANWTQKSRLSLRQQVADSTHSAAANADLTSFGLFPSNDGQNVYTLTPMGLIRLSHDLSGRLNGNWLPMSDRFSSVLRYEVVQ